MPSPWFVINIPAQTYPRLVYINKKLERVLGRYRNSIENQSRYPKSKFQHVYEILDGLISDPEIVQFGECYEDVLYAPPPTTSTASRHYGAEAGSKGDTTRKQEGREPEESTSPSAFVVVLNVQEHLQEAGLDRLLTLADHVCI
jgi:hypothetical protein